MSDEIEKTPEAAPTEAAVETVEPSAKEMEETAAAPAEAATAPTPAPPPARTKPKKGLSPYLVGLVALIAGLVIGFRANQVRENSVVVSVNGEEIGLREFLHRCETAAGAPVLRQMINERLALQFARQQGAMPAESEVEARYLKAIQQPDVAQKLQTSRETPDDLRQSVRIALAQQAIVTKNVTVTDADVLQFYNANINPANPKARYYQPETATVAIIVSRNQNDIKNAARDLASGTPFATAAAKYSQDNSRTNGGQLPSLRRGQISATQYPGLEAILFGLQPGQQRDLVPVQDTKSGQQSWWLIRCLDHKPAVTLPLDKVKDDCRQQALLLKGSQANGQEAQAKYEAFKKATIVKVYIPQYKDAASLGK